MNRRVEETGRRLAFQPVGEIYYRAAPNLKRGAINAMEIRQTGPLRRARLQDLDVSEPHWHHDVAGIEHTWRVNETAAVRIG